MVTTTLYRNHKTSNNQANQTKQIKWRCVVYLTTLPVDHITQHTRELSVRKELNHLWKEEASV